MPIGVTYGLVTGISDAMTPAGFAYLTMPLVGHLLDDADALLPQRVAQDAEHLRAPASARGLPMPLSSTLMLREAGGGRLVAARPGDGAAQPIDRGLVVGARSACIAASRASSSACAIACSSGVIVRAGAVATAIVTIRSGAAARRRRSTGILIRIGFSRVYSSSTSALSPRRGRR